MFAHAFSKSNSILASLSRNNRFDFDLEGRI